MIARDIARSVWFGVLFTSWLWLHECSTTHADDMTPALALATVCAGETSWDRLDECSAIGDVLARRSETGTVTESIAKAYSSALRSPRRRWVVELDADGTQPEHWPARLSWDRDGAEDGWTMRARCALAGSRWIATGRATRSGV